MATATVEAFLDQLCRVRADDDEYLMLVEQTGSAVPSEPRIWLCKNTLAVVQVRIINLVCGEAHDYDKGPADVNFQGGIYPLKCKKCTHELQVKRIPPLGLLQLIPPPSTYPTPAEVDVLLLKLKAVSGLYYVLHRFQQDPTCQSVSLHGSCKGAAPRYASDLRVDAELLAQFVASCSEFKLAAENEGSTDAPSAIQLVGGCSRPRTRGILLKALLEVKMLIVIAVEHLEANECILNPRQCQNFTNLVIELHEDCLSGGVGAQYKQVTPSWDSLRALVCGPSLPLSLAPKEADDRVHLTTAAANKVLDDCMLNLQRNVWPKLQQKVTTEGLDLPDVRELGSSAGGAEFKKRYCKIWNAAIRAYLFDLVHSPQYPQGPAHGIAYIRQQYSRPDKALRVLCPSLALDIIIGDAVDEMEKVLNDAKADRMKQSDGPIGVGLVNPGENLCASNALLQTLFAVEPWRSAVLAAPAVPDSEDSDGARLVAGMQRLFQEMSGPSRFSVCARHVAASLYGKDLGTQQDCDELMHRLATLLDDWPGAAAGNPWESLRRAFRELFFGLTSEVRLGLSSKNELKDEDFAPHVLENMDEGDGNCGNKPFLAIPVQAGSKTLAQALEEFTAWSAAAGRDVAWTQERFRVFPPCLCFSSRQVSALAEWEESIDICRFVAAAKAPPELQRRRFERSRALQVRQEVSEALEHLDRARQHVRKAGLLGVDCLSVEGSHLEKAQVQLQARQGHLECVAGELANEAEGAVEDASLECLFSGLLPDGKVAASIRQRFGCENGKDLISKALEKGEPSEALKALVNDGPDGLTPGELDAVVSKLRDWQDWQRQQMYDIHSIVLYQGVGEWGHYIAFVRQLDGGYLLFDDEQVRSFPNAAAVRSEIIERGMATGVPAGIRTVMYRQRPRQDGSAIGPLSTEQEPGKTMHANGAQNNGNKRANSCCVSIAVAETSTSESKRRR